MSGKFQLKKAANGTYHFSLHAANGEIILSSEMYKLKRSARNGIASIQRNAAESARFERRKSKDEKPFFVLKAANHQVIGKSEMYESDRAMENGITSVQKNGVTSEVEDLS